MTLRRLPLLLLAAAVLQIVAFSSSLARTWYVAADGSGDAPSLAAAVDSSQSGDQLLLGPGTHNVQSLVGGGVTLKAGTTLTSQSGPLATILIASAGPLQPGLIETRSNCFVSGVTLVGGQNSSLQCNGTNVEAFGNIVRGRVDITGTVRFHHNLVDLPGEAVFIHSVAPVQIYNNIILGDVVLATPNCFFNVEITCNLIQASPVCVGIWLGNINADPLFCGAPSNYYLRADSPCAPGHVYDFMNCGLIGPLPVACGTVSARTTTWGAVKSLYKE